MIEILQKQRQYFNTFQTFDVKFRIEQLKKLKEKILEKRDDIFDAFKKDMNKHEFEVIVSELGLVMNELNYMIKNIKRLAEDKISSASILNYPAKNFQIYEPYGLTLVVSPWNYPFQLTMIPVLGAIAGGNTVVVKPSRNTPEVTKVIKDILSIFPEEYVYVVTEDEKVEQLFDLNFDFIFYTGSAKIGRELLAKQAKNITPMVLELGGKCPCFVSKSANLNAAARRIAFGKFLNAGQTCVAPDFLLVDRKVKDKFIAKLVKHIQQFYYKDGVLTDTFVNVINEKALNNLLERVNPTQVVFGGKVEGLKMEPTVMDDVTFGDPIMQEEIFGPVLPIIAYDDIEEVISYLRTQPKPLAVYYFGKNQKEGAMVLKRCPSGGGCINEVIMHVTEEGLPFGGVGESGIGSYHGAKTFYAFVHEKSVLKRSTWFDFKQKYPPVDEKKIKSAKAIFNLKDPKVKQEKEGKNKEVLDETLSDNVIAEPIEKDFDEILLPDMEMTVDNMTTKDEAEQEIEEANTLETTETPVIEDVENLETENNETETVEKFAETEIEDTKPAVEDDEENPEINYVEETQEVEDVESTEPEIVEELGDEDDEIANITEQTSTIDREPEDFELDETPEGVEEIENVEDEIIEEFGDEEDEISDEEKEISEIDNELSRISADEDEDDGEAEQADDLVSETEVEQIPVETEDEPIDTEMVVDAEDEPRLVDEEVEEPPLEPIEEQEDESNEESVEEETEEYTKPTESRVYSSSWGDEEETETVEKTNREYTSQYGDYSNEEERKPYRIIDETPAEVEETKEEPSEVETVEEVKEVVEEKPKKTATKKTTKKEDGEEKAEKKETAKKFTTKKTTAKKATTAKKSTAKTTTKKTEKEPVEKKKAEPKAKAPKEPKEPKEKKVSKKTDALNDAQRAQDEINAMLNNMMPSSAPAKDKESDDDDFLNSLNSLVSKNIETSDDE